MKLFSMFLTFLSQFVCLFGNFLSLIFQLTNSLPSCSRSAILSINLFVNCNDQKQFSRPPFDSAGTIPASMSTMIPVNFLQSPPLSQLTSLSQIFVLSFVKCCHGDCYCCELEAGDGRAPSTCPHIPLCPSQQAPRAFTPCSQHLWLHPRPGLSPQTALCIPTPNSASQLTSLGTDECREYKSFRSLTL